MQTLFYIVLMLWLHQTQQVNQIGILRSARYPASWIGRHKINSNSSIFTNQFRQKSNLHVVNENIENEIDNLLTHNKVNISPKKEVSNKLDTNKGGFNKVLSGKYIPVTSNKVLTKQNVSKEQVNGKPHEVHHGYRSEATNFASQNQIKTRFGVPSIKKDVFRNVVVTQKVEKHKGQPVSKFTDDEDDHLEDSDYVSKAQAILNQYKDIEIFEEEEEAAAEDNKDENKSTFKEKNASLKDEKTSTKSSSDEVFEKSPKKVVEENRNIETEKTETGASDNSQIQKEAKTPIIANDTTEVENPDKTGKDDSLNLVKQDKNETRGNNSSLTQENKSEDIIQSIQVKNEQPEAAENIEKSKSDPYSELKIDNKLNDQVNGSVLIENVSHQEPTYQSSTQVKNTVNVTNLDQLQMPLSSALGDAISKEESAVKEITKDIENKPVNNLDLSSAVGDKFNSVENSAEKENKEYKEKLDLNENPNTDQFKNFNDGKEGDFYRTPSDEKFLKSKNDNLEFLKVNLSGENKTAEKFVATDKIPSNVTVKRGSALTFSKVFTIEKKPSLSEEDTKKILKEEDESEKYDQLAEQRVPKENTNVNNRNLTNKVWPIKPVTKEINDAVEDTAERAYASLDGPTSDSSLNKENISRNVKEDEIYASIDNGLTRNKTSEELEQAKSKMLSEETEEWRKHVYKEADEINLKHKHKKKIIAWVPARITRDGSVSKKERLFRKQNQLKLTPIERKMAEILILEGHNTRKQHGTVSPKHNKTTLKSKKAFFSKNNVTQLNILSENSAKQSTNQQNVFVTDKRKWKTDVNNTINRKNTTDDVGYVSRQSNVNVINGGKQSKVVVVNIGKPFRAVYNNFNQTRTVNANNSKALESDVYENEKCSLDDYLCHSTETSLKREEIVKQRKVIDEAELKNEERIDQETDIALERAKELANDVARELNETVDSKMYETERGRHNESMKFPTASNLYENSQINKSKNLIQNQSIRKNEEQRFTNFKTSENDVIATQSEKVASDLVGINNKKVETTNPTSNKTYFETGYKNQTTNRKVEQITTNSATYDKTSNSVDRISLSKHTDAVQHMFNALKENEKTQRISQDDRNETINHKPKVENIVHVFIEKRPVKNSKKHLRNLKAGISKMNNKMNANRRKKLSLASKLTEEEIEKLLVAANALKHIDISSLIQGGVKPSKSPISASVEQKHRNKKVVESKHFTKARINSKDALKYQITSKNNTATLEATIKLPNNEEVETRVSMIGKESTDAETHVINITGKKPVDKELHFINKTERETAGTTYKPGDIGMNQTNKIESTDRESTKVNKTDNLESTEKEINLMEKTDEIEKRIADAEKKKAKAEYEKKMAEDQIQFAEKQKTIAEEQKAIIEKAKQNSINKTLSRINENKETYTEQNRETREQEKTAALQNEALAEQNIRVAELQIEKLQQQNDRVNLNEVKSQRKHVDTPILETSYLNTSEKRNRTANSISSLLQPEVIQKLKNLLPLTILNKMDFSNVDELHENTPSIAHAPIMSIFNLPFPSKNIDNKVWNSTLKEEKEKPSKSLIDSVSKEEIYNSSNLQDGDVASHSVQQPSETESLSKLMRLMNLEEFSFVQNKENSASLNLSVPNESKTFRDFQSAMISPQSSLSYNNNISSVVMKNVSNNGNNLQNFPQFTNVTQNNIFSNSILEKELLALAPSTNAIPHPKKNIAEEVPNSNKKEFPFTQGTTAEGEVAESVATEIDDHYQAASSANGTAIQWLNYPDATIESRKLFQTKNQTLNMVPTILENALRLNFNDSQNKTGDENSVLEKTKSVDLANPPSNVALPDYVVKSKTREATPSHRGAMLLSVAMANVTNLLSEQKTNNEIARKQHKADADEQSSVKELTKDVSSAMEELETLMKEKTEAVNKVVRQKEHISLKVGHSSQDEDIVESDELNAIKSDKPTDSSLILAPKKSQKNDFSTLLSKRNKTEEDSQEEGFTKIQNENKQLVKDKIKKFIENLKSKLANDELKKFVKASDLLTRKLKSLQSENKNFETDGSKYFKKNFTKKWDSDTSDDIYAKSNRDTDDIDVDRENNHLESNPNISNDEKKTTQSLMVLTNSDHNLDKKIKVIEVNYSTKDGMAPILNESVKQLNEQSSENSKNFDDTTAINSATTGADGNRDFVPSFSFFNKTLISNEEVETTNAIRKYLKENVRQRNVPTLLAEEPASDIINEIKTDIMKQKFVNDEILKQNKLYYANNLTDLNESETKKIKNETVDEAEEGYTQPGDAHDTPTPTTSKTTTRSELEEGKFKQNLAFESEKSKEENNENFVEQKYLNEENNVTNFTQRKIFLNNVSEQMSSTKNTASVSSDQNSIQTKTVKNNSTVSGYSSSDGVKTQEYSSMNVTASNPDFNLTTTVDPYSTFKREKIGNRKSLMLRPSLDQMSSKKRKEKNKRKFVSNRAYIIPLIATSKHNFDIINKNKQRNWSYLTYPISSVTSQLNNVKNYPLNPVIRDNTYLKHFQQNFLQKQVENPYLLQLRMQQALQNQRKLHAQQNANKWKQYAIALQKQRLQQQARRANLYQRYNTQISPQYYPKILIARRDQNMRSPFFYRT